MKRYYFQGTIILTEPLHIGSEDKEEFIDNPILRDEHGKPIIPGTSIAGIMSSLFERILKLNGYSDAGIDNERRLLFGAGDKDAIESCLLVLDSHLVSSEEPMIEDHNTVNRSRGSAQEGHLFHTEILPSRSRFTFMCEFREKLRADDKNRKALSFLLDILELMERGWAWVGGRSGTGHGRFKLEGLCCKMMDMTEPDHILTFTTNTFEDAIMALPAEDISELKLKRGRVSITSKVSSQDGQFSPEVILIEGILRPIEPILVKTGLSLESVSLEGALLEEEIGEKLKACKIKEESVTVDSAFCRERSVPYLPGSSIRGVLRSHTERMIRTIVYSNISKSGISTTKADELCLEAAWTVEQMKECAKALKEEKAEEIIKRACLVSSIFGFPSMGGRICVSNAYPINPMAFEQGLKLMDHVAINRFTGGASEGKKFNIRPFFPTKPPDEKGDMQFYICLLDFEKWHFGLVALILKDLMNGRIAIGHGRNKGFGIVRLIPETIMIKVLTSEAGSLKGYLNKNNSMGQIIEGEIKVEKGKNFWINKSSDFYRYVVDSIEEFKKKINDWIEIRKGAYE